MFTALPLSGEVRMCCQQRARTCDERPIGTHVSD